MAMIGVIPQHHGHMGWPGFVPTMTNATLQTAYMPMYGGVVGYPAPMPMNAVPTPLPVCAQHVQPALQPVYGGHPVQMPPVQMPPVTASAYQHTSALPVTNLNLKPVVELPQPSPRTLEPKPETESPPPSARTLTAAVESPRPTPRALPTGPGKEQESDRMELMAEGIRSTDAATSGIRLVSLGCYCGPKLSFKQMGRGSETLPFDWMRTRLDGLLDFMRSDFEGFFDVISHEPVPNSHMTVYRNYNHSFWHDDPTDPQMHERYQRRIERFMSIDAHSEPVLFVRVMATTDEIPRLPELLDELRYRFGSKAYLLCLATMQDGSVDGPGLVETCPGLMLHYLHYNAYSGLKPGEATYGSAVQTALDWIVGRQVVARQFRTLAEAHAVAKPSNIGDEAYGLRAFEGPAVPARRR